jgi:hypothetical protein
MPRETQVIDGIPGGGGATIEVDEGIFAVLTYEKRDGETCNDVVPGRAARGGRRDRGGHPHQGRAGHRRVHRTGHRPRPPREHGVHLPGPPVRRRRAADPGRAWDASASAGLTLFRPAARPGLAGQAHEADRRARARRDLELLAAEENLATLRRRREQLRVLAGDAAGDDRATPLARPGDDAAPLRGPWSACASTQAALTQCDE